MTSASDTDTRPLLLYDSPSSSLGGPSYTGLVTRKGETWSIPTGPSPSQVQSVSRAEDYVYDYGARLSAWDDSSDGEDISYDARGNITSRSPRHGSGGTVTMTYTGDRLATRKVGTAPAVSFAHDSFARMTTDAGAGLSITYNALDLPERISQGTALKAKYTYLADGTKVSALNASGAGLVYRRPFTYRRASGGSLSFESAPFDRGRLTGAGLNKVVQEISILASSNQVYNVFYDDRFNTSTEYVSGTEYNFDTNEIDIILGDWSLNSLAHELKHAYQFEIGAFSSGPGGLPFYDQTDEREAYERGELFGGPHYHILPDTYMNLSSRQKSASSIPEFYLNRNNPSVLQQKANRFNRIAFRVNGITYVSYKK